MQKLTFKSYLSEYTRHLSGLETNNLRKLAAEAQTNYRLREPLLLYAYCVNKVDLLWGAMRGSELGKLYASVSAFLSFPEMLKALESKSSALDERYHKCYHSYVCRRDMAKTYERKKQLMLDKIKALQSAKGVTTYRVYTDLNLNGSNVNSFVEHGPGR